MRKENNVQNIVIVVLAITVLVMTVGYAAFTQTLKIENSTATFKKAKWDVHFDTASFSETSTIKASPAPTVSLTSVAFTVTLNKPGDIYSFTINAKNEGTMDAVMKKITMSSLTADQEKFINYKVTYNGTDYTATTDGLNHSIANTSGVHTIVVTVEYERPENPEDLPTEEDVTVNLSASFDYEAVV